MKAAHSVLNIYENLRTRKKRPELLRAPPRIIHLSTASCPEFYQSVTIKVLDRAARLRS